MGGKINSVNREVASASILYNLSCWLLTWIPSSEGLPKPLGSLVKAYQHADDEKRRIVKPILNLRQIVSLPIQLF